MSFDKFMYVHTQLKCNSTFMASYTRGIVNEAFMPFGYPNSSLKNRLVVRWYALEKSAQEVTVPYNLTSSSRVNKIDTLTKII